MGRTNVVLLRGSDREVVARNLTYVQREDNTKTQGEDSHLQRKSILEQVHASRPSEKTNPANTLIFELLASKTVRN